MPKRIQNNRNHLDAIQNYYDKNNLGGFWRKRVSDRSAQRIPPEKGIRLLPTSEGVLFFYKNLIFTRLRISCSLHYSNVPYSSYRLIDSSSCFIILLNGVKFLFSKRCAKRHSNGLKYPSAIIDNHTKNSNP